LSLEPCYTARRVRNRRKVRADAGGGLRVQSADRQTFGFGPKAATLQPALGLSPQREGAAMRTYRTTWWLAAVALVFVLPGARPAAAKDGNSASPAQDTAQVQKVPSGQEMKILGIVVKRHADSFIMRDQANVETEVALTPSTEVKTHRKGAFRGGKQY